MAKKGFKRVNPAEAFITIFEEKENIEGQVDNLNASAEKISKAEENSEEVLERGNLVETVETPIKMEVKEVAKESPQVERVITPTVVPEGYKPNPKFIETKSKKVQLLLQPSVVESIKTLARQNGVSMNEAINQAIQEYVARHTENNGNS